MLSAEWFKIVREVKQRQTQLVFKNNTSKFTHGNGASE